jgi:hypothetical protein
MGKKIEIVQYRDEYKEKWDRFVMEDSVNGTFLQTMNFLEYHPNDRFQDNSLMFMNGTNIVAVIPAHCAEDNGKKLMSHLGSTFGGIVAGKAFYNISYMDAIFEALDEYAKENDFDEVLLKQTGRVFQTSNSDLIDYYMFLNGYKCYMEMGYYIDYADYNEDIISNYNGSRRRGYNQSLKSQFTFKKLETESEIGEFFDVLCDNYTKFGKLPVHTLDELLNFKFSRLKDNVMFYGVYLDGKMMAGTMVFRFGNGTWHTQYLAARQEQTDLHVNEFMYTNIIRTAKEAGARQLSFGISTEEHGSVLNRNLAQFKEGYGTKEDINYTFIKKY